MFECGGSPRKYADDTNVTFSAATIPDVESQINSDLKYIDRWLKANKLILNVAKTEFSSKQKLQSLRWLDWIFWGWYLLSLSINYVGMSKDIKKRLPQLYYIKMKNS